MTMGVAAAGEWMSFTISEKKSGQPLIVHSLSHTNSIFKVFPRCTIVGQAAVLAEGDAAERKDIIFLEPLPLFLH